MYPELFLYIPVMLKFLGIGTMASYKIFLLIINFMTFITMYLTSNKILKDRKISVLVSIIYTLSLYRLSNVFVRAALGELLSMIFFPLILYGLYDILFSKRDKWWILVFSIFGIANSHVLSFALAIGLIIVICFINIRRILKDKKILKTLVVTAILSILSVLSIYLPILEQYMNIDFKVKNNDSSLVLSEDALTISKIFENELKNGYSENGDETVCGAMTVGAGLLLLIFPSLLILKNKKDDNINRNKYILQLIFIGTITLLMTTKIFPWKYIKILNIIQFPWRLNLIYTLVMSIVSGYAIYFAFENKRDTLIIISILIILVSGKWMQEVNINEFNLKSYDELISYSPIGNGEYLPKNLNLSDNNIDMIDLENSSIIPYKKVNAKIEAYIDKNIGTKIQIPLIYYKGYQAYIIDKNDQKIKLVVDHTDKGLVLVENENKLEGILYIKYKITLITSISYLISILTLVSILIYIIYKLKKVQV